MIYIKKFGIILMFFATILLWFLLVVPFVLKIPNNFKYEADVISVDNFYDPILKKFKGEQYSKTKFYYEVLSSNRFDLDIKNVFDVQTVDGKPVFKAEPVYKVNSITGVVSGESTQQKSYLFAPRNLKKYQNFTYRHVTSDEPLNMKYVAEEYLYGLKVYKYKKDDPKPFDQTKFLTFYDGVGVDKGIKLISDVNIWVEPVSGYVVKIEDFSVDYYYYDLKTGEKLYPHNQFLNTYSEESTKYHAQNALNKKLLTYTVVLVLPIVFLLTLATYLLFSSGKYQKTTNQIKMLSMPAFIFILFVIVSILVNRYIVKNRDVYFLDKSQEIKLLMEKELNIYIDALLGSKGMFDASQTVTAKEWQIYVDSLNLEKNYPGLQGLGYAKVFSKNELPSVENEIRSQGFTQFKVFPVDDRDFYTSIIYIEPKDERNLKAMGYDMYTEEKRRQAMARAAETNLPSMSNKVTLLQEIDEDVQPGFLVYLPVYKNGDLDGFVYNVFRVKDLINSMFVIDYPDIDIRIYDGLKTTEKNLIYSTSDEKINKILFRKTESIYIAGNVWTIEYTNSKTYTDSLTNKLLPYIFLSSGFVVSFLVLIIMNAMSNSEKKAIEYAKELNSELEQNRLYLVKKNSELESKIKEVSALNKLMVDRELKMIEMKRKLERLDNETQ